MNKYKIIALIGESGSGKDTILKEALSKDKGLHEIVSYTTRSPRKGEKDGVNYHFVSNDEFAGLVLNRKMIEAAEFNGWFYGTGYESLSKEKVNIGVFNPEGIDSMKLYKDINLIVFYIEATDKNRLIRQLNREENPNIEEIFRRYKTDKNDFYDLDFHYNAVENNNKEDLDYAVNVICSAAQRLKVKNN